jgi:hypothetical protein
VELKLSAIFKECCFLRYDVDRVGIKEREELARKAKEYLDEAVVVADTISVYHPIFNYHLSQIRRLCMEITYLTRKKGG